MTQQLTLGGLLAALEALDPSLPVYMAGFGVATSPFEASRHRPHSDGLAIHVGYRKSPSTVEGLISVLRRNLQRGVPGEFVATLDTPMWAQPVRALEFDAVTGVEVAKGHAMIRCTNVAPVQGPSLQRLTDEETGLRMLELEERRTGKPGTRLPANAERYLIHSLPADRSDTLRALAEDEAELTRIRERIKRNTAYLARLNYMLGITDTLPVVPNAGEAARHE